jgi:bifunctional non-homologous end joining protein LigD
VLAQKIALETNERGCVTKRFSRILQAARRMKATSFLLDGEGIVYDRKGMPSFALLHSRDYDKEVSLCAFDLLELSGTEVRKQPLVERKRAPRGFSLEGERRD